MGKNIKYIIAAIAIALIGVSTLLSGSSDDLLGKVRSSKKLSLKQCERLQKVINNPNIAQHYKVKYGQYFNAYNCGSIMNDQGSANVRTTKSQEENTLDKRNNKRRQTKDRAQMRIDAAKKKFDAMSDEELKGFLMKRKALYTRRYPESRYPGKAEKEFQKYLDAYDLTYEANKNEETKLQEQTKSRAQMRIDAAKKKFDAMSDEELKGFLMKRKALYTRRYPESRYPGKAEEEFQKYLDIYDLTYEADKGEEEEENEVDGSADGNDGDDTGARDSEDEATDETEEEETEEEIEYSDAGIEFSFDTRADGIYDADVFPTGTCVDSSCAVTLAEVNVKTTGQDLNLRKIFFSNDDNSNDFTQRVGTLFLIDKASGSIIDTGTLSDYGGSHDGVVTFDGFAYELNNGTTHELEVKGEIYPLTRPSHEGSFLKMYLDFSGFGITEEGEPLYDHIKVIDSAGFTIEPANITNNAQNESAYQQLHHITHGPIEIEFDERADAIYDADVSPTGTCSDASCAVTLAEVNIKASGGDFLMKKIKFSNDDNSNDFSRRIGTLFLIDKASGTIVDSGSLSDSGGSHDGIVTFDGFTYELDNGTTHELEVKGEILTLSRPSHEGSYIKLYLNFLDDGVQSDDIEIIDGATGEYVIPHSIKNNAKDGDAYQQRHTIVEGEEESIEE